MDVNSSNPHAGLLNLAAAMTGRPVDMDRVQILDAAVFGEMAQLMMKASAIALAEGAGRMPDIGGDTGYVQDDGRLLVQFDLPGGITRIIEAPPGSWREMSQSDRAAADREFARMQSEGSQDQMIGEILGMLEDTARHRDEVMERFENVDQVITVFDRSADSLVMLRQMTESAGIPVDMVEEWLASDSPYFLISTGGEDDHRWSVPAENEAMLLAVADYLAEGGEAGTVMSRAMLVNLIGDESVKDLLSAHWKACGGVLP